jgi:hypothetical protein
MGDAGWTGSCGGSVPTHSSRPTPPLPPALDPRVSLTPTLSCTLHTHTPVRHGVAKHNALLNFTDPTTGNKNVNQDGLLSPCPDPTRWPTPGIITTTIYAPYKDHIHNPVHSTSSPHPYYHKLYPPLRATTFIANGELISHRRAYTTTTPPHKSIYTP